jgi:hypothetical protein
LSDAQNWWFISQYLGEMPLNGEVSRKAVECAFSQKIADGRAHPDRLKAGTWRDMKNKSVLMPGVCDKSVSVSVVDCLESLSELALMARRLRLAGEKTGIFEGSVTPSLDNEGIVKAEYSLRSSVRQGGEFVFCE